MLLCSSKTNPAQRHFVVRMWSGGGLCALFAVLAALGFRTFHFKGVLAYLVAVLPALPIVGQLVATGVYLSEETDEFQRNLLVQCLLGGIGGTLAAAMMWGYVEDFTRAPHLDLVWVYPAFWVFVALSMPVVKLRYK